MVNGLPRASAARFAQALRQAIKLLFEFWLQPYPNRHDNYVLNDLFNCLAVRRWAGPLMACTRAFEGCTRPWLEEGDSSARERALDQLVLLGHT